MENKIKLGKNIKYLREKARLDQQQLADKLNVSRSTLTCWENEIRVPKLDKIIEIADFFETDMNIICKDLSKEE